ncbi:hypothetical protein N0V82_005954 [Gnomoniopsis sp. IMI 355080]|nr:hypothetical protein N0V82_005954 [Gnomoniopsis sp. IMI 355080]
MQHIASLVLAASVASAHYTIPIINDAPAWTAVRKANNWQDNGFVSDVTSDDIRCNQLSPGNDTISVAAGDEVAVTFNNDIYHPGPFQSYMAKVPEGEDVNTWDPTDAVWFKIYQDSLVSGSSTATWTSDGKSTVNVAVPSCLAPGDYLMRNEQIALHVAQSSGGAQFYLSCGQLTVTGGGSTQPSGDSLAAFPGAYKATDPGILININYPVPTSYTNPGPAPFTC